MVSLSTLGMGQLLCYLFLVSLGNVRNNIIACEMAFFSAFLLYGMTLFVLRKRLFTIPGDKSFISVIVCFALCFRICMWASTPALSDDIYRYLWEGQLLIAGINPYIHAPSDPSIAHLQDTAVFPLINHKEYSAIYPPLNQLMFALSAAISPTIGMMKLTFMVFDLLTIAVLLLILRELHMDRDRVIIYAWNPLVIVEFAGSGHLDSAGIFFLMLALYLFTKKRIYAPTVFLALAFLNKLLPLIFLPLLLTRRKLINLGIFAFTALLLYLPFIDAGRKLFQSLLSYSQHWVFNASVYEVFVGMGSSPIQARVISAAMLLLVIMGLISRHVMQRKNEDGQLMYRVGYMVIGSLMLLTPVLHPWYLCWMVPFLVIHPNRAWILLTGLIFLSYWILRGYGETGIWQENMAVKIVEYLPFYILLLFDAARSYRTQPTSRMLGSLLRTGNGLLHRHPAGKTDG